MTQPPPLPPLRVVNDTDTEPGLGLIAVKQENARLRQERDEARQERDSLRAGVTISEPPPSKRAKNILAGTKYAALVPLIALAGRAAARKWPQLQELVDGILQWGGF